MEHSGYPRQQEPQSGFPVPDPKLRAFFSVCAKKNPLARPPTGMVTLDMLAAIAATLLLAGLWTPIAVALVAMIELWTASFSHPPDPSTSYPAGNPRRRAGASGARCLG